ncbi:protein-L-isoaspartate(D-aspartate) O-methyltransferase [Aliiglaciecola sp. 2_MG-2023]|uniref:protein-L-isoaspartate(D-aspartate) O-methyltransferase n=1 Tax=unclassified Aliiglaciecola TaxID=2593648 RepID=UPI0026E4781B|nr:MULTISPECIES: protein-L-isoaspartate(D-aspartate) O-methyltransferase [unclassified Aliiglaciecola]MDO6711324.1 protein-L-isoaspartate(D-aspartate) O-methyltransferase [Aliiglaciecola sp. 2_MG-2023]MDO6752227.1 protein-L-isoaspartate(D-aspartate) O-methyltransferase [Aliiglaciecola sp. 1_MG-2023]
MKRATRKGQSLAQLIHAEGIQEQRVLQAVAATPRELFLPDALHHKAYENTALPIGQGQTISQPYIVAKMTELLLSSDAQNHSVLEIGTGSGYQTAILAQLFNKVFSVERIKALQFQAKRRMNQLDLHNVSMKHGDGWKGWANKGPFDGIIVTAAASHMPTELYQQLNDGGMLVIPVGTDDQKLHVVVRNKDEFNTTIVESVRFVPLVAGDII